MSENEKTYDCVVTETIEPEAEAGPEPEAEAGPEPEAEAGPEPEAEAGPGEPLAA